jgi:hypothetical protein
METRVLLAVSRGSNRPDELPAVGWGGDRYRVITTPEGPALVWYIVFDEEASGARFLRTAGGRLAATARAGYGARLEPVQLAAHAALRLIVAPVGWPGWAHPPLATVRVP